MDNMGISRNSICSELITAYKAANSDLQKRLRILMLEARHLQQTAGYLLGCSGIFKSLGEEEDIFKTLYRSSSPEALADFSQILQKNIDDSGGGTDTGMLVGLVAVAVQQLKHDMYSDLLCLKDQLEGVSLDNITLRPSLYDLGQGIDARLNKERTKLAQIKLKECIYRYIFEQAALRQRANIYAQRLGNLQDRLGQEMEHVSPDHPGPTVRRRQEHGLTDKYLSELARWVHRDLIVLTNNKFKCAYPYEYTPLTLQYWEYDYTSRNSAFRCDIEHRDWRDWILKDKRQGSDHYIPDSKAYSQFVLVQQAYWMLERPVLHPMMGHELAHRVLRDVLGKHNPLVVANKKHSGILGRLVRRITHCIEDWASSASVDPIRLPLEIMCDLYATARFGHSYLYAWFLEILASEFESDDQIKDEFGRYDLQDIDAVVEEPHPFPSDIIPADYLRGKAILAWLEAASVQHDAQAKALRTAVNEHLEILANLRFSKSPDLKYLWKHCSEDLQRAVKKSGAPQKSAELWRGFTQNRESKLSDDEWFYFRQQLGEEARKWLGTKLDGIDSSTLYSASEIPWRLEWLNNSARVIEKQHDPISYFSFAMEDYLYRVGNPKRLAKLIETEPTNGLDARNEQKELLTANCIDPKSHMESFRRYTGKVFERRSPYDLYLVKDFGKKIQGTRVNYNSDIIGQWFGEVSVVYNLELNIISVPYEKTLADCHAHGKTWFSGGGRILKENNAALLGRYDHYVLTKIENDYPDWEHVMYNIGDDGERFYPPYSSRRRIVREIFPSEGKPYSKKDEITPYFIIMIGMKWHGMRLLFTQWINEHGEAEIVRNNTCRIFLSNGWEDFVIFLSPKTIEEASIVVQALFDNPMVDRTETIFTTRAIANPIIGSVKTAIRYQYHIRVKSNRQASFINSFQDQVCKAVKVKCSDGESYPSSSRAKPSEDRVFFNHLVGPMDFVISAPNLSLKKHKKLLEELHKLKEVAKIHTNVMCLKPNLATTNNK